MRGAECGVWSAGCGVRGAGCRERDRGGREGGGARPQRLWGPVLCRDWGLAHLSPSVQVMALGMQVLILNCGVQQILAGEVTRGGLLSFLLYQEEVGHHVRVSETSS